MKVVKTITPADVTPEPFWARCEECIWASLATRYAESAVTVGENHVRAFKHRVVIVEDEP